MPFPADLRRRIRAAMALAGVTSWEQLADQADLSRSTVAGLGTPRGKNREGHIRAIGAACGVPYEWFTVPDLGAAVVRDDDDVTLVERVEALELQMAAVLRRDRRGGPPKNGPSKP
jgi:hypothetical protein